MSIRLLSEIWELEIGGTDREVLQVLADHANDQGICWPDVATIVHKVGKDRRNVQKALRRLEDDHHVVKRLAYERGGQGKATVYRLTFANAARKPPLERPESGSFEKGGASAAVSKSRDETAPLTCDDGASENKGGASAAVSEKGGASTAVSDPKGGADAAVSDEQRAALTRVRAAEPSRYSGAGAAPTVRTIKNRARGDAPKPKTSSEVAELLATELVDGEPVRATAIKQALDRLAAFETRNGAPHENPWPYALAIAVDEHRWIVEQERTLSRRQELEERVANCDNPECTNGFVIDDDNIAHPCGTCRSVEVPA